MPFSKANQAHLMAVLAACLMMASACAVSSTDGREFACTTEAHLGPVLIELRPKGSANGCSDVRGVTPVEGEKWVGAMVDVASIPDGGLFSYAVEIVAICSNGQKSHGLGSANRASVSTPFTLEVALDLPEGCGIPKLVLSGVRRTPME